MLRWTRIITMVFSFVLDSFPVSLHRRRALVVLHVFCG
jgi:hypothetical protein